MGKKIIDLSGQRFGKLYVLTFVEVKNGKAYFLCRCDCGNEVVVQGRSLKTGNTKSCGCYNKEQVFKKFFINLKDYVFGKLTVVGLSGKNKNGKYMWTCECECGNQIDVSGNALQRNNTKSCGCHKGKFCSDANLINLEGKTFSYLKVLKIYSKTSYGKITWLCKCVCGNEVIAVGGNLKSGNTTSCGCKHESHIAYETKKYFVANYNAIAEYRILKNPDTNYSLPYDVYLPKENIFIEINGKQHYYLTEFYIQQAKKNNTTPEYEFEYRKKLDLMKLKYAQQNGIFIEIDLRKIKTVEQAIEKIEKIIGEIKINE